jgi:lysophospholipid acyltransferase (LPLAT)-like uncharacterized protein
VPPSTEHDAESPLEVPRFSLKQRLALWLIPPLAHALLMLLGGTLRFDYSWEDEADAGESGRSPHPGSIVPSWHECLLLAAYAYRDSKATVIVSSSFDGECIARTVHRLGLRTVRGSSTRGGSEALRAMPGAAQGGFMAFTADGPKGPARVAKVGPVMLARSTGRPICCFHLAPRHAWRLHSWDRMLIPRPFTRVHVRWSKRIDVPAAANQQEISAFHQQLQAALERVRLEAGRQVKSKIED